MNALTLLLATAAPDALASLGPSAHELVGVEVTADAEYSLDAVQIKMHNAGAADVLNAALTSDSYWSDAKKSSYKDELYDEIRLKPIPGGYVPMITGEGGQDFDHDLVADIVFRKQSHLPRYMSGAKKVVYLGSGYDSTVGANYRDAYFFLDLAFLYVTFTQRMYRKTLDDGRTVLWFEKCDESMVSAAQWGTYQTTIEKVSAQVELRWPPFNSVVPVGDIYGMFVVTPGTTHSTRITFVSKMTFGDEAGWMAKLGSKMPPVLRKGLRAGFDASVKIAKRAQEAQGG